MRLQAAAETRRTVTAVFQDVTGSTALGESLDPEVVRHIMTRYFTEMKAELERHGGMVEKFIGDAVMAVFGVPRAREDDPLRALRAAVGMRERLERLNAKLEADFGVRLRVRTGVNTGEVVVGAVEHGQHLALGDPINVAARLEQAAEPGEILIGEPTLRLVRDAVRIEPVEPLALKGKSDPVPAFRLLEVVAGAAPVVRRFDTPFVGRVSELETLRAAFAESVGERRCSLVTVVGEPGIGKSRLALELAATVDGGARFLRGRCLAYGEGITFLPIGELVREAARISEGDTPERALAKIETLVPDNVAGHVGEALGLVDGDADTGTLFYAVRRLLEALAAERPLLCAFDDIHWAEETFLDFLEYLAGFSTGAPITVLCLARPELLDIRPGWPATVRLSPLESDDASGLVAALASEYDLPADACERIAAAAEGNPLFAEQLVALAAESGEIGGLTVPPTVQAVLAERLNRLTPAELAVAQRAAVAGKVFSRDAVTALSPEHERRSLVSTLQALARRGMIRPELDGDEDAFRFSHVLICEAAYTTIPKLTRADLHEQLGYRLEEHAPEPFTELHEVAGYHLEQASLLRRELHPRDERAAEIGRRAAEHLGASGKRALARSDIATAMGLLERAVAVAGPAGSLALELRFDLAKACVEHGEYDRAADLYHEVSVGAADMGQTAIDWRARLGAETLRLQLAVCRLDDALSLGTEAAAALDDVGEPRGVLEAYELVFEVDHARGRAQSREMTASAMQLARELGSAKDERWWRGILVVDDFFGPAPLAGVAKELESLLSAAKAERHRFHEAYFADALAWARAMQGRFEEARKLLTTRSEGYEGLGMDVWETMQPGRYRVEILAGDLERADEVLVEVCELAAASYTAALASHLLLRAELMLERGRFEAAERLASEAAPRLMDEDVYDQFMCRTVGARLHALRCELECAEVLAREALEIADQTDMVDFWGDARLVLADVLSQRSSHAEALAHVEKAESIWAAKGNVVLAAKARALCDRIREQSARGGSSIVPPG